MTSDFDSWWLLTSKCVPQLFVLDEVASTNSWAIEEDLDEFSLVVSWNQTGGRGRWNRSWQSHPGRTLAVSIVLSRAEFDSDEIMNDGWLSLVAGGCIIRSLWELGALEAELKWPNDVVLGERKLAGILVEAHSRDKFVVGLGLNVRPLDSPGISRAVSLSEILEVSPQTVDELLSIYVNQIRGARRFDAEQSRNFVLATMGTVGRNVLVQPREGDSWQGFAEGIDHRGALLVRNAAGSLLPQFVTEIEHLLQ